MAWRKGVVGDGLRRALVVSDLEKKQGREMVPLRNCDSGLGCLFAMGNVFLPSLEAINFLSLSSSTPALSS